MFLFFNKQNTNNKQQTSDVWSSNLFLPAMIFNELDLHKDETTERHSIQQTQNSNKKLQSQKNETKNEFKIRSCTLPVWGWSSTDSTYIRASTDYTSILAKTQDLFCAPVIPTVTASSLTVPTLSEVGPHKRKPLLHHKVHILQLAKVSFHKVGLLDW